MADVAAWLEESVERSIREGRARARAEGSDPDAAPATVMMFGGFGGGPSTYRVMTDGRIEVVADEEEEEE